MPEPLVRLSDGPEWSVRVTFLCKSGTSRARAEQIAQSIQKYGEARPGVSHAYERDVYDLDTLYEPDDD